MLLRRTNLSAILSVFAFYFAWMLFFGGALLCRQVLAAYATRGVLINGEIVRGQIYTGWGMYNNLGAALDIMMLGAFYFAAGRNKGHPLSCGGVCVLCRCRPDASRNFRLKLSFSFDCVAQFIA